MLTSAQALLFYRLLWPLLALLAAVVLWTSTVLDTRIGLQESALQGRKTAAAAADAYEQYLTRSLAQMDQITMHLKYDWEKARDVGFLAALRRNGLFTDEAFVQVSIVDREGAIVASLPPGAAIAGLHDASVTRYHRNNNSSAMLVGAAPPELALARDTVLLTRRLDNTDDEFDGFILVALDARWLTTFSGLASLGSGASLALKSSDGSVHLEQVAGGPVTQGSDLVPLRAALFEAAHGSQILGAERIIAWRSSPAYGLTGVITLTHADASAHASQAVAQRRVNAVLATLCLLLFALLTTVLGWRSAQHIGDEDQMQGELLGRHGHAGVQAHAAHAADPIAMAATGLIAPCPPPTPSSPPARGRRSAPQPI